MLQNIPISCGTNVGGLRHLQLVRVEDVISIPAAVNSIVATAISLRAGATMATIQFPPQSADFSEKEKESDIGAIINAQIRCDIPKDAPELGKWANDNLEAEVIAIYADGNGTPVIVGDLERPLQLHVSRGTGRKYADKNGMEIVVEGISTHYAYYYQMFEKLTPGNRNVYTAGYTFGYLRTP